jgi:hypothetical protein
MAEPLTDAERQALGWLRDGEHDRFRAAAPRVRDGLVKRGLVLRSRSRGGERYVITNWGLEALGAPRWGA